VDQLHRVSVEGEVWVVAADKEAAESHVRGLLRGGGLAHELGLYVYPFLPVQLNMLSDEVLERAPWFGDGRTVREWLEEIARARTPAMGTVVSKVK
jgi:hypothetical protein